MLQCVDEQIDWKRLVDVSVRKFPHFKGIFKKYAEEMSRMRQWCSFRIPMWAVCISIRRNC